MNYHLEAYTGAMFSGKTTSLIKKFQSLPINDKYIFAHSDSQRFSKDHVQTHDGTKQLAHVVSDFVELRSIAKHETDWVFIDEIHFFSESEKYETFYEFLSYYRQITIGGLDCDFRKVEFPWFQNLLAFRKQFPHVQILPLTGRCNLCGGVSRYTMKQRMTGQLIERGGAELYHAVCEKCWALPSEEMLV